MQWDIIDQRLSWSATHSRNRQTGDTLQTDTPENQIDRTVFQTGPVLNYRFAGSNTLELGATWADNSFDDDELDSSSQTSVNVKYNRGISPLLEVGVTGNRSEVDVDSFSYTSQQLTADITARRKYFDVSLSVGPNQVERDDAPSSSSTSYSLSISGANAFGAWSLSANRQLTDTITGLAQSGNLPDPLVNGDTNFDQAANVERTRTEFSYSRTILPKRLTGQLSFSIDEQNFEDEQSDEKNMNGSASLTVYSASQKLSANLHQQWQRTEDQADTELLYERRTNLDIRYRINANLSLSLFASHVRRDEGPRTPGYQEDSVGIRLSLTL